MSRRTVAEVARDILLNDPNFKGHRLVSYEDATLLSYIYKEAGLKVKDESRNGIRTAVLNALNGNSRSKNPLFKKDLSKSFGGWARVFILIKQV